MNKPFLSFRDGIKIVSIELISIVPPLLSVGPAHAAGSNMPWEQPLQQVLQSVEGPVAKIIAVIIIVTTGLTLAFGDTSGGFPVSHGRRQARLITLQTFGDAALHLIVDQIHRIAPFIIRAQT